jgi:glyoxylase-like metal-dependent hydrolase (beta-lactamase superfamily II)
MALSQTFTLGALRCHLLEAGRMWLDGGAMFGVVPRTMWARQITPDEKHRIPLVMRCLLIEHPEGLVLVDTGAGNKEEAKFLDIYGLENAGLEGATQLEDALATAGFLPGDIRWVINTHLHFDHAGGNTRLAPAESPNRPIAQSPNGPIVRSPVLLAFPNATYIVQRNELEFARHTNERTRASYLPHNYEPIAAANRWRLIEGDVEILPGIASRLTPGHIPWHQSIVVQSRGETVVFLGDVMPTHHHLPLVWIMGYDLEPLRTLESKRALLRDAVAGGWRVIFEHDAKAGVCWQHGAWLRSTLAPPPPRIAYYGHGIAAPLHRRRSHRLPLRRPALRGRPRGAAGDAVTPSPPRTDRCTPHPGAGQLPRPRGGGHRAGLPGRHRLRDPHEGGAGRLRGAPR